MVQHAPLHTVNHSPLPSFCLKISIACFASTPSSSQFRSASTTGFSAINNNQKEGNSIIGPRHCWPCSGNLQTNKSHLRLDGRVSLVERFSGERKHRGKVTGTAHRVQKWSLATKSGRKTGVCAAVRWKKIALTTEQKTNRRKVFYWTGSQDQRSTGRLGCNAS